MYFNHYVHLSCNTVNVWPINIFFSFFNFCSYSINFLFFTKSENKTYNHQNFMEKLINILGLSTEIQ